MTKRPGVSVVIPTYNEEKYIGECIKSLNSQSLKNFEIVVVDDGSTDRTREIVKRFKNVRLIKGEHKGPGVSRNLGARKAQGEVLVFVDADMTFHKQYLAKLVAPLIKNRNVVGTTHDYEVATNMESKWSQLWGKVRVTKTIPDKEGYVEGMIVFRAIRRKKFLEVGGFDPSYGYADDQSLFLNHKIRPVVALGTTCYHKNPETLKEVYKQSRWIGASIQSSFFMLPAIKHFSLFLAIAISPVAILWLSIKNCFRLNNWKLFFPWGLAFMGARYYGTISGLIRKIYLKKNYR